MCNLPSSANTLPSAAWRNLFDLDQIEAILQATARAGKAISYSDMLDALGYVFSRPKMRALCVALHEVDQRAARRGQPELAVLVVRASDGIPGAGWWSGANTARYSGTHEGPQALAYIKKLQAKVFKHWQFQTCHPGAGRDPEFNAR